MRPLPGYPNPGGGTGGTRTRGLLNPNQARCQLRYCSICAADAPSGQEGGRSPPEPPRRFFARRDATRLCEGGIWRKVSALTTLTWTGKGPVPGMPSRHGKTPEPQSCAPLEEVTGIEPASPGWEPGILTPGRYLHMYPPLRYRRSGKSATVGGIAKDRGGGQFKPPRLVAVIKPESYATGVWPRPLHPRPSHLHHLPFLPPRLVCCNFMP